jgi:uncharacterized protein YndB with AHSA1/START domain
MTTGSLKVSTPSDREIAGARVFDAPRGLVFDAFTKPELLQRWLGLRAGWTLPVCEVDLRPGGAYRWVWRGPDGTEMGVGGIYREVVRPERVIATEVWDRPWYAGKGQVKVEFTEQDGKTTMVTTVLYETGEIRDSVLKTPMTAGMAESYDKLAELLASMR